MVLHIHNLLREEYHNDKNIQSQFHKLINFNENQGYLELKDTKNSVKSSFLLSFSRALKLPLKLLVAWLGKNKYSLKKVKKKDYEPKFKKNERRIESLFKEKKPSKSKQKNK